ncbi:hypothetical protein [Rhodopirellula sallentina]|uniref:Signal peptide protein n=1 Tax=Rhodopirellula sallentina SM41 TaxID=1263870 RepID=M5TZC4_9BACT|nr:hypothetical protein [Rhodopirellula sallentina]EMI54562.1 signal peptide protein [Rhodopirellula sallentina SM41]
MKTRTKNWIRTAAALAILGTSCNPVFACGGGGGGGYRGGYGGGYAVAPSPSTCGSAGYAAPARYAAPQPRFNSVAPSAPSRFQHPGPASTSASFASGQNVGFRGQQPSAPRSSSRTAPQQQAQFTGARSGFANGNTNPTTRTNTASVQPVRQNAAPVQSNGSRAVAQTRSQNNPAPTQPSEASALQMLASLSGNANSNAGNSAVSSSIPEFGRAASDTTAAATPAPHVGTWTVSLPGDQSVSLILNDDSTFTWSATKGGSTKSFNGEYRLDNDRLSLKRASDLQQMQGSWTASANGFVFKVDGDTTGSLNFTRS